uniref:PH_15 domain-containing protein n=1 Tax=Pristionchus pacificus TaxID=54126 RepID=A0A2A6CI13_PRIPA|eukprot:PDM77693.1 hypothetical protein PRIPAC_34560 [Pristionchus pacificus]
MKLRDMPDQETVCAEEGVLCGLAEVEERRSFGRSSWDKQMCVLRPTGCLLIYKYYLLGKGKGVPEIGRIVHLPELHRLTISMKRVTLTVELTGKNKTVTRLRFEGELVPIWGAKLFLSVVDSSYRTLP